jgi:hypothetical protein
MMLQPARLEIKDRPCCAFLSTNQEVLQKLKSSWANSPAHQDLLQILD